MASFEESYNEPTFEGDIGDTVPMHTARYVRHLRENSGPVSNALLAGLLAGVVIVFFKKERSRGRGVVEARSRLARASGMRDSMNN